MANTGVQGFSTKYVIMLVVTVTEWEVDPIYTPPKSNIDTKNDGFTNESPFKYDYFG